MLKDTLGNRDKNRTALRDLAHNPYRRSTNLFCQGCADFNRCGGIAAKEGAGYCYNHCCGGKPDCETVCRQNPNFDAQIREIGGFDFGNIPHSAPLRAPALRGAAPLILHGKRRTGLLIAPIVAIKLRDLVNLRTGTLKYADRSALASAFKIRADSHLVITGIEQEHFVEPWWSLGRKARAPLLKEIAAMGIALVTPPNFSLFNDVPRTSNFSALKRIGMVQAEFNVAGIPCSLHPHIRNETDSARWVAYVAERPEIKSIAYEFSTGAGRYPVKDMHIEHLTRLAQQSGRPLDLVIRGDQRILPILRGVYRNVLYIDTNAFMKTMHRQSAIRSGNAGLDWVSQRTPEGAHLDDLLQHNVDEVTFATRHHLARAA
ncbi:hypothetical protein [Hyphococcus luteus]|uniref:DUF4417 domain-containing protein n=1 Tax=Hyphococcus luteus TaxID=2058213 RepID=A0A2S7K504_9PROT|nr:hypothetical protein [Marinicaulis flavus]PQA87590.1 hypothetical protein CW354_10950 [Marinicaulis flavus]